MPNISQTAPPPPLHQPITTACGSLYTRGQLIKVNNNKKKIQKIQIKNRETFARNRFVRKIRNGRNRCCKIVRNAEQQQQQQQKVRNGDTIKNCKQFMNSENAFKL